MSGTHDALVVGVTLIVTDMVALAVGVLGERVRVRVRDGVRDAVSDIVGDTDGVSVVEAVTDEVVDVELVAEAVGVGVGDGDGVGVDDAADADATTTASPIQTRHTCSFIMGVSDKGCLFSSVRKRAPAPRWTV